LGYTTLDEVLQNEISQHNIVEKGLVLFQVLIDPHSVVDSTIEWTIDNYWYDKICQEMERDALQERSGR